MQSIFPLNHLVDSPIRSTQIAAFNLYPDRSIGLPESDLLDVQAMLAL
jgi:hypothetical protein